ncbi:MAG: LPS assembly lipoprotein LptE, partial [Ramlibacter sp.]
MNNQRRLVLLSAASAALAGCGFRLRGVPSFAFSTIHINGPENSPLLNELRQQIASSGSVQVIRESARATEAQVVLDIVSEQREKVVVGLNASGQVREFQLRIRLKFRLRTPQAKELIPETELLQQR